jgi:AraC-like DNA-binding protein
LGQVLAIQKFSVSTGGHSARLDEEARFKLWQETYCGRIDDLKRLSSDPFAGRWSFTRIGDFGMCRFRGTPHAGQRETAQIPNAADEKLSLGFNLAATSHRFFQRGRETVVPDVQPLLYRADEAYGYVGASDYVVMAFPRRMLGALGARAEALVGKSLDGDLPALRHLRRYLCMLDGPDMATDDPALADHVLDTIEDLAVLALGASGDAEAMAQMRGMRSARLAETTALIARSFADPAFSVQRLAMMVGVSPSYIQKLLHESGRSFTERVLELRLAKARTMLADRRNDRLKVSDIALACGFNDISYFNRSFRRRFGGAPNDYRSG